MFVKYINYEHFIFHGAVVTKWNGKTSYGIGMFIFMCSNPPKDINENISNKETYSRTLVHEYGHTIQSLIFGPLFFPAVALPSCIWAFVPHYKNKRKAKNLSYYSAYPENFANYLGEKVTHSKSMGNAIIDF